MYCTIYKQALAYLENNKKQDIIKFAENGTYTCISMSIDVVLLGIIHCHSYFKWRKITFHIKPFEKVYWLHRMMVVNSEQPRLTVG